eukprot:392039_1
MTELSTYSNQITPKLTVNPLIILNMGAEMIYILEQRLKAQKITSDKSSRVLLDTVSALFDSTMIDTIFKQRRIYESSAVRQLFHQITHSSIMRLNDQSMDKLYDLMLMGLKVQLLRSRDCYELIESTLNHIDNIYNIINNSNLIDAINDTDNNSENESILNMIHNVRERITRTYLVLISLPKLLVVRKYLFQWLQDRRIKVSILLQKNLQSLDGHIITNTKGILPKYTEIPGKQYRITLQNLKEYNSNLKQNNLILLNSKCCYANNIKYTFQFNKLHTNIGENLYQVKSKNNKNNNTNSSSPNKQNSHKRILISNAVKNQLNDLSSIINEKQLCSNSQKKKIINSNQDIIKLDLFEIDFNDKNTTNDTKIDETVMRFGTKTSALKDALDKLNLGDEFEETKTNDNDDEYDIFDLLNDVEQ